MYEIKMPRFGLTMESGFVEKWFKKEGEKIKG
jgi:pyruvate/2-oxoglutarate dehydrogenase complex dihydrolipoamide acyltransferase (E2) component